MSLYLFCRRGYGLCSKKKEMRLSMVLPPYKVLVFWGVNQSWNLTEKWDGYEVMFTTIT